MATRAAHRAILAGLHDLGVAGKLGEEHTETLARELAAVAMQAGYVELKRATRRPTEDGR